MASFLEELWNSIFTPGPTPTLLIATNAAFAALQFLLLILLIATYSIHFLILSALCGGLWYSINWFANEISHAQAEQAAAAQQKKEKNPEPDNASDTETEGTPAPPVEAFKPPRPVVSAKEKVVTTGRETASEVQKPVSRQEKLKQAPALLEPRLAESDEAFRRRRSLGDSSGYVSTDSEWEKVSEGDERGK